MPALAAPTVSLEIALFAGDELTHAYPTGPLATAICRLVKPARIDQLQDVIYGKGWPVDEITNRELHAMRRGFRAWTQATRTE